MGVVQILLRANANPLAASVWGGTPLAIAKVNGHVESARLLQVAAVQENWGSLKHAVMELCTDREFILAAVQRHWEAFEYATEELRVDREIVLAAVRKQNWEALDFAAEEIRVG